MGAITSVGSLLSMHEMFRAPLLTALLAIQLFGAAAPRFELAEIERSAPAMNPYTFISGNVLRGARYDLRKATMLDLIRIAYKVDAEAIVGGPNWLEFDRFDIAAKAPPGSSPETVRLMLQTLLSERFKLAVHRDTRPMPAFTLSQGKGKARLTESTGSVNPECRYQQQPAGSTFTGYACRNVTMKDFAQRLHEMANEYLVEPVVDATGIDGAWDFDLKWNSRSLVLPAGVARTTIFDAVEKQLGLSLTLRDAPAPVLVIDHVNEKPTDNPPDVALKLPPREVEFEVADLKPSYPGEPGGMYVSPGGGLITTAVNMRTLMGAAWDVDWSHMERFAGLPKWTDTERFDIRAKAAATTDAPPFMGPGYLDDDVRLMLRALLIDRFKIRFHVEDRPADGYTLAAGKPKMKRGNPAVRAGCSESHSIANDPRDVNPRLSRLLVCRNTTMAQFASELQEIAPDYFAFPVEDATGLAGGWDFTLSFSPSWMLRDGGPDGGASPTAASEPTGALSLPDAVGKQMGLKLEKQKRMLPIIVIDHMEEKPTEN